MRDLLSICLLFFLFFSVPLQAQQNTPTYFDDVIIIKYENSDVIQKLNASQPMPVKQQVQSIMSKYGLSDIQPVWKDQYDNQIRKTLAKRSKLSQFKDPAAELRRIYSMNYSGKIDPVLLAKKLSAIPGVEYASPRYIYQTFLDPNDPTSNDYYDVHNFRAAWDITTGSSDVVIAVVDGGVNYNHEELSANIWTNDDEIPGNEIDDDDNGFVDDYYGWDFWQSGVTFQTLTSDNDPIAEFTDHGSHVAGIAAAEGNNGVGTAGAGFSSSVMSIKAGGIQDNPSTEGDESRSIGFGNEGIIYAAANGADIINCSFGGPFFDSFGQDAVDFATEMGALVVAASGNDGQNLASYPASLRGVLSVGSVAADTTVANYSNYGYTLDVLATGSFVYSVAGFDSSSYGLKTGTSMASPVVAGLAALIKAENPDWGPDRIRTQIRNTASPLSGISDPSLYGNGSIDALAALTEIKPGIGLFNTSISDTEGNSLSTGEAGIIEIGITNYGLSTTGLTVTLEAVQEEIEITSASYSVGAISTGDSTTVQFEITLPEDYDLADTPTFVLSYEDPNSNYLDYEVVVFSDLYFSISGANNIAMSFGVNGTIGFADPFNSLGGIGFIPSGFTNILYEGGIIIREGGNILQGIDPGLANNVRGQGAVYNNDFDPGDNFGINSPGEVSEADGSGSFIPNNASDIGNFVTSLKTFAFTEEALQNVVLAQYEILNTSAENMKDLYMGIFTDWDVDDFSNNNVGYNSEENYMYIFDATETSNYPYVAIAAMQATSSNLAIDNAYEGNPTPFRFNLYDGFSDDEKTNAMRAGQNNSTEVGSDISTVVASGPYVIGTQSSARIGFIFAYGNDVEELTAYIRAAKDKGAFETDEPGTYTDNEFDGTVPFATDLKQNYPNPFNPSTEISFELAETGLTELSVYNILGQKVQTLVNSTLTAGAHSVSFNASEFSSGIYLVVLKTNNVTKTIKMTLLK